MILTPLALRSELLRLPEYGMGYQKALVRLNRGGTEIGFILNTELFVKIGEWTSPFLFDWDAAIAEARKTSLVITEFNLIPRSLDSMKGVRRVIALNANATYQTESRSFSSGKNAGAAIDAPIELTSNGEVFNRFSAYSNDRRITLNNGILAGTFATTKEDAEANIRTGADAVSRYALENKTPASYKYTISPPGGTALQRGVAQPAYGELGGGVEVLFVNASPDNIVTGPIKIPDK